ncbi:ADP-ribosylation factor-like protein 6-interacting protein 6 [Stegastes partitus]|uniref:ADP ribosylation factor like GTPase 6 interacting protein 6 n=1 Tax=Stegastes partitus TaxID=144197 RepID=A0A3B5AE79_9TELE|nr:PREDICTED: ADP-ribosylation factor-like protein 6-interacting protein 6 [Stegastes partitus]
MPSSATDRDVFRDSLGGSSGDMHRTDLMGGITGEGPAGSPVAPRNGPKPRAAVVLSVLASAVTVAAVGCFCALVYPIVKELRAERVRGEDGTEQRMLGFWSILVLSVLVGCICCVLSWTFTYLNSYQPGMVFPTLLTLAHFRDGSGHDFHMSYGVAVLNGIMAMLTVIWSLS